MREFVEATPREGICYIEPSLMDTGGPVYKKLPRSMYENVINVKSML